MKYKKISNKITIIMVLLISLFVNVFLCSGFAEAVTFTDVSASSGIEQISPSWGVSWADVNSDGLMDVYVNNHQYWPYFEGILMPPSLFINRGDGTFLNENVAYGLIYEGDQHGGVWGDFNNDGLSDLFQPRGSNQGQTPSPNFLYLNQGSGMPFLDIAASSGLDLAPARGRGGCWFDHDNDGFLDLYVNFIEVPAGYPSTLYRNRGDQTFEDIGEAAGVRVLKSRGCTPMDYDNDGLRDLFVASNDAVNPFYLFKKNGNGTYSDVTETSFPDDEVAPFGYAWGDYNNDGFIDLFVTGMSEGNKHDVSDQNIHFMSIIKYGGASGIDFTVSEGSTITFDFYEYEWRISQTEIYLGQNRIKASSNPVVLAYDDATAFGDPGFTPGAEEATFIWHEGGRWHVRSTILTEDVSGFFSGIISTDGLFSDVSFTHASSEVGSPSATPPSRLYQNQGDGTFIDVAASAGVDGARGLAAQWLDVDNDGDEDLYVVENGELWNSPNKFYINNGDGTFTDMAASMNAEADVAGKGENAAFGDYDNDGFLDLFVTNGRGPAPFSFGKNTLLHNNGNDNHWLKIKMNGALSNRDAIGAVVSVTSNGQTQTRQHTGQVTKYSQNSPLLHFGLGSSVKAEVIEITWPSGIEETISDVAADQTLEVSEPSVELEIIPHTMAFSPGEYLLYNVKITNKSDRYVTLEAWSELTDSDDKIINNMPGPLTVTLPPGGSKMKTISKEIPSGAQRGLYRLTGYLGKHSPLWIWASRYFDFWVFSSPSNITIEKKTSVYDTGIVDVKVIGSYAYGVLLSGMRIFDVTDTSTPVLVSELDLDGKLSALEVQGSYAYIAAENTGMHVVDISNPLAPVKVSTLVSPWKLEGAVKDISVSGSLAVLAKESRGIVIVDISDPSNPVNVGEFDILQYEYIRRVEIEGSLVFLADRETGLRIVDISDTAHPVEIGRAEIANRITLDVIVQGYYAYIAATKALMIYDISNPALPVKVGQLLLADYAWSVSVKNNYAYVIDKAFGLFIIDVSDQTNPVLMGTYDSKDWDYEVDVVNDIAFIAGGWTSSLVTVDISDVSSPTLRGVYEFNGEVHGLYVSGSYAYQTTGKNGLHVLDITNPEIPVILATLPSEGAGFSLVVHNNRAYVADGVEGLRIVDVTTPGNPMELSKILTPSLAYSVDEKDSIVYIADGDGGLVIVNVYDTENPYIMSTLALPGFASGIKVRDSLAYIADGDGGLQIVDVTDPSAPVPAGAYSTLGPAWNVILSENTAFVSVGREGVEVLDISDPANVVQSGRTISGLYYSNTSLEMFGSYLLVGNKASGFFIFDVSDLAKPKMLYWIKTPCFPVTTGSIRVHAPYIFVADFADLGIYRFQQNK